MAHSENGHVEDLQRLRSGAHPRPCQASARLLNTSPRAEPSPAFQCWQKKTEELRPAIPDHLAPFYAVEAHSMLELEPPRHSRLRSLVLRAFTSRRIAALKDGIGVLCHELIDAFPDGDFDLLDAYARPLPVTIIARLLGVPARGP